MDERKPPKLTDDFDPEAFKRAQQAKTRANLEKVDAITHEDTILGLREKLTTIGNKIKHLNFELNGARVGYAIEMNKGVEERDAKVIADEENIIARLEKELDSSLGE